MIPKINIIKWHYEYGISIDDIAEIVDLFEEAKKKNMRVNTMIRKLRGIVRYQKQIANILRVSPSMVSLRYNDRVGITDRVLLCPSVFDVEQVLELFGVWETYRIQIVQIYQDNPRKYWTPAKFTELLQAFGIYSKADVIASHLFG